jgi:hypothetical protein
LERGADLGSLVRRGADILFSTDPMLRVRASMSPIAEALLEGYCKPRVA